MFWTTKTRSEPEPDETIVRYFMPRDLDAVVEIEELCFPSPWNRETFKGLMQDPSKTALVYTKREIVIGFIAYEVCHHRVEILNLGVHPDDRYRGAGRTLVDRIKVRLHPNLRRHCDAMVSESNLQAQLFFSRMGFVASDYVRGWYDDGSDAINFVFHAHWRKIEC